MSRSDRSTLPERLIESAEAFSGEILTRIEAAAEIPALAAERDAWADVAAQHGCATPAALAMLLAGYRDAAVRTRDHTEEATAHLRGVIKGSGACLTIEDDVDLIELTHAHGREIAVYRALPHQVEELAGALRTAGKYRRAA